MKKFTREEMSESNLKCAQYYIKGREVMKQFQDGCTQDTFIFLFEKDEGERLWKHFVFGCSRNMDKFLTYLTDDQKGNLWIQLFSYTNLAKGII